MRHRKNKLLELNTGVQKKQNFIRNMLTNFVLNWKMLTTPKRAKVLKAETDSFFSKLVAMYSKYEEKDAKREAIRLVKQTLFSEDAGKKVINELLPRYISEEKKSFVANYKMWVRKWDGVEKIYLKLL